MEEKETERRAVEDFFFFFLKREMVGKKIREIRILFCVFFRFRDRYRMQ